MEEYYERNFDRAAGYFRGVLKACPSDPVAAMLLERSQQLPSEPAARRLGRRGGHDAQSEPALRLTPSTILGRRTAHARTPGQGAEAQGHPRPRHRWAGGVCLRPGLRHHARRAEGDPPGDREGRHQQPDEGQPRDVHRQGGQARSPLSHPRQRRGPRRPGRWGSASCTSFSSAGNRRPPGRTPPPSPRKASSSRR